MKRKVVGNEWFLGDYTETPPPRQLTHSKWKINISAFLDVADSFQHFAKNQEEMPHHHMESYITKSQ